MDETQDVRARATARTANAAPKRKDISIQPSNLPLDLLVQGREMFFGYYIADFSRIWDFLYPYFRSSVGPDYLTLSIDAASLAFLSHQVNSPSAQQLGRRKYISALRKINAALQCPRTAHEATTLQTSMLLDLFEKISSSASRTEDVNRAHIDGALTLVKLKGLDQFTDDVGLKVLTRLLLNATVSYFSQRDPVSPEIREVREHLAQFTDTSDPKWKSAGLVLEATDLVSGVGRESRTQEQRVQYCIELDRQLEQVSREAPPVWSYKRIYVSLSETGGRVLDDFYDVYTDRVTTQRWNALRIVRLFLCEEILASLHAIKDLDSSLLRHGTSTAVALLIQEICACVPQMTDCDDVAQHKLPQGTASSTHSHTLSQVLDAYILIYPLYAACWSRECPRATRAWIIVQLERIAEHFSIKEAKLVVDILRGRNEGSRVGPWEVYRLLGSYAFAA
jgi:hypothetical protein